MPLRDRTMELALTGSQRDHGVIVTAREQATREMVTIHSWGHVVPALREVVAALDRHPGDWRIVSISTPRSIYRDLHGQRGERRMSAHENRLTTAADPRSVEQNLLQRIGRRELLEPLPTRSAADLERGQNRRRR